MTATLTTPMFHVEHDQPYCRLATQDDLPALQSLYARMLRELAPMGHDVLPTPHNLVIYTDYIFAPALATGQHGIFLALAGDTHIGAVWATPEQTMFEMCHPKRVITHGLYVEPEWRGSTIALRLLSQMRRRLKGLGYKTLVHYILTLNQPMQRLVRRGSAPTGTQYITPI